MADLVSVASSALPPGTRTLAFRGTEAMSTLYRFEIFLLVNDSAFDMDAALGASASLSIEREGTAPLVFHGVIATFESVDDLAGGTVYRAELAPRVWQLTLTQHSRVFVDETVPAILQTVLREAGLGADDVDFRLSGEYSRMPHVCQYRESNFAFLSRRMEREGIYFLFEQGEAKERLVVTDDRAYHAQLSEEPVRYVRVGGAGAWGAPGLRTFKSKRTSVPGSVKVRDYDYLRPTLEISGGTSTSGQGEDLHLYGENALTPEDGARLSRIRTEEHAAQSAVFRGAGATLSLRPGYTFKLEDHPRLDGSYLVTELSHRCKNVSGLAGIDDLLGEEYEGDYVYAVEVAAIAASRQFRPARRTPVPRIYGMEGAVVDGPADTDYAQLDEHGRYFVKMRFDESPAKDGKASARVRMMQPHGGNPEAFHFPLRKGTEVLLAFEGGDPDRPVIAGVVPNLLNASPVTSKNATKNVLQTGGGNRFTIEDLDGKQHIRIWSPTHSSFLHMGAPNASHNHISYTLGNSLSATGIDTETNAGGNRLTVIGTFFYPFPGGPDYTGFTFKSGATPGDDTNVTGATEEADPAPTATTLQEEAYKISAAKENNSDDAATVNPSGTHGDLTIMGVLVAHDPDTRQQYNQGSDIKYVMGDNITKVVNDSISAVQGNSVSHIHGQSIAFIGTGSGPNMWAASAPPASLGGSPLPAAGTPIQQSTVYGGALSLIFAPSHLKSSSAADTDLLFFASHVPTDGSEAQRSLVAGDQYSYVTGKVSTNIMGGHGTSVSGGTTTTISGGQTTYVDHRETYAGNTLAITGNATSVTGVKESLTLGNLNIVAGVDFKYRLGVAFNFHTGPATIDNHVFEAKIVETIHTVVCPVIQMVASSAFNVDTPLFMSNVAMHVLNTAFIAVS